MRSFLFLTVGCVGIYALPLFSAETQPTLPERYLAIYMQMHDAENSEKQGRTEDALKGFQACYDGLGAIHQEDPGWEESLVVHRMHDCNVAIEKLEDVVAKAGAKTATTTGTIVQPVPATPSMVPPPADSPDITGSLVFTNSGPKPKNTYPWKTGIITTVFWIGEKTKLNNTWNLQVPPGGASDDSPDDRNGYSPATHASFFNPFYVALPFNDLAYPDKAKQFLPAGWQRPDKDGKPVSACIDRWVEIKTEDGSGHICYAQWKDVGPFHNDDADYVFGPGKEGPSQGAGLTVSPAVAQYLMLGTGKGKNTTRWRFIDAQDVPPGVWLKLEEQAIIYTAMHQSKDATAKKK